MTAFDWCSTNGMVGEVATILYSCPMFDISGHPSAPRMAHQHQPHAACALPISIPSNYEYRRRMPWRRLRFSVHMGCRRKDSPAER